MMSGLRDANDHAPLRPVKAGPVVAGASNTGKALGAAIRLHRRRAGLSQSVVAAQFGLTYQQWQKYETGQNRVSAVTLHALAQYLGVDIRRFFLAFDSDGLAQPQEPMEPAAGSLRVLLVDDDEDGRNMTAMMLRAEGYAVSLAAGGDQAFAALALQEFDAIVSDYAMPGMNGAALLELALERQPGLAAMMITGYATDAGLYKLRGDIRILAKPFTRQQIVSSLEMALHAAGHGVAVNAKATALS